MAVDGLSSRRPVELSYCLTLYRTVRHHLSLITTLSALLMDADDQIYLRLRYWRLHSDLCLSFASCFSALSTSLFVCILFSIVSANLYVSLVVSSTC